MLTYMLWLHYPDVAGRLGDTDTAALEEELAALLLNDEPHPLTDSPLSTAPAHEDHKVQMLFNNNSLYSNILAWWWCNTITTWRANPTAPGHQ